MPNTTNYDFGDVVLIEYTQTDQRTSEKRPAVVVSAETYNVSHIDIVAMPITSQGHQVDHGAIEIHDWSGSGLLKKSYIKPILGTYEREAVLKPLGKLDPRTRLALKKAIAGIFGFKQASSPT